MEIIPVASAVILDEVHDFAATVVGGELHPGDDADDARWVSDAELDDLPLTTGLADYLRGAGLFAAQSPT